VGLPRQGQAWVRGNGPGTGGGGKIRPDKEAGAGECCTRLIFTELGRPGDKRERPAQKKQPPPKSRRLGEVRSWKAKGKHPMGKGPKKNMPIARGLVGGRSKYQVSRGDFPHLGGEGQCGKKTCSWAEKVVAPPKRHMGRYRMQPPRGKPGEKKELANLGTG